jgi:hypothetical protein
MIKILPLDQIRVQKKSKEYYLQHIESDNKKSLSEIINAEYSLFNSGREAIGAIMNFLKLTREDEVYITTTTDSSYVSTCVSATIFNFCKISRVLTEKTKAIFVIHTFCFPHPNLIELKKIAEEKNIILIEDCISSFDSYNDENIRLGSIGDFAVYSLPKILPVEYGGVLTSKMQLLKGNNDDYLNNEIVKWIPKLFSIKIRRQERYNLLKKTITNNIYGDVKNINPFMFGFTTADFLNLIDKSEYFDEGRTHVKNEVHIPMNPFTEISQYEKILDELL